MARIIVFFGIISLLSACGEGDTNATVVDTTLPKGTKQIAAAPEAIGGENDAPPEFDLADVTAIDAGTGGTSAYDYGSSFPSTYTRPYEPAYSDEAESEGEYASEGQTARQAEIARSQQMADEALEAAAAALESASDAVNEAAQ